MNSIIDDEHYTSLTTGPPSVSTRSKATWGGSSHASEYVRSNDGTHLKPVLDDVDPMSRSKIRLDASISFSVGCYNVTTLNYDLASDHLEACLRNYKYDILAITETHLTGQQVNCNGRLLLSGGNKHYAGVGILMSPRAKACVQSVYYISCRMMAARFTLKRGTLLFIAVYAPTSDAPDDVITAFYDDLQDCIDMYKTSRDTLVIAGDLNAKLGDSNTCAPVLGPHGYGDRNTRGDKLFDFCLAYNLTAAHSWFPGRAGRKITWISRAGNAKNTIDYVLVSQSAKNLLTLCRSFGACFDTDHRLVICNMKIKFAKRRPPPKQQQRPNIRALGNAGVASNLCNAVAGKVTRGDSLQQIAKTVDDETMRICGVQNTTINQPYLSDKTLQLIERKEQARGTSTFNQLRSDIKASCRTDLENWLNKTIDEMNDAYISNDSRTLFKATSKLLQKPRSPAASIKDKDGRVLESAEDEINRWHEYAVTLFTSNLPRPPRISITTSNSLPSLKETADAINNLKVNKATGADRVTAEALKVVSKDHNVLLAIHDAVCKIWSSGKWPPTMTESVYIALHKKNDRGDCGNYRTLALISHASKIVLHLIQRKLQEVADREVRPTQFGFVGGKGTCDAIYTLKGIAEAYLTVKQDLHAVFVDYKKAFDSVNHLLLIRKLIALGVPSNVVTLVEDLYYNANGRLFWKSLLTDSFVTPVGVRQGCPLSPTLFNLYTECLMREWYAQTAHITPPNVNGIVMKEASYADDLVMLALNADDAESMLDVLGNISERYGLHIHPRKTEYMVFSSTFDDHTLSFRDSPIPRVQSFNYLGVTISYNLCDSKEISMRIGMGKAALRNCSYLRSQRVSSDTKVRLARALILSKVSYGSSTLTLKSSDIKKYDSLGRSIWRGMLNIRWQDHVSNEVLYEMIGGRWCFSSNDIIHRKATWLGHAARQGGIARAVIDGLPAGTRRGPGRPRLRWVNNISNWSGQTPAELVAAGVRRDEIMPKAIVHRHYNLRSRGLRRDFIL